MMRVKIGSLTSFLCSELPRNELPLNLELRRFDVLTLGTSNPQFTFVVRILSTKETIELTKVIPERH